MDEEIRMEFAKDIKREITNINFLVQALLKLSKLDADSFKFNNEYVEISKIIERNNGCIRVESKIGKGTKFTIKYFSVNN